MNHKNCNCAEGRTYRVLSHVKTSYNHDGKLYADVATPTNLHVHDCDYIARRSDPLILDAAEAEATRKTGKKYAPCEEWHRHFFAAVDRMVK